MAVRVRTKRMIVVTTSVVTCLILGALAFVFYFMHAVYEVEEELSPEDVPLVVRENFEERYPGVSDVVWEFEEGLYEAEFSRPGKKEMEVALNPDGSWSATEFTIELADLPEKARTYLASQNGYEIVEVKRIEVDGAPVTFEAELKSKLMKWECIFDAEGNLLSREREGPVLEQSPGEDPDE